MKYLKRFKKGIDGVFGNFFNDHDELQAVTLEHAYATDGADQAWTSKIPDGSYRCVRGRHRLPWHEPVIDPRFEALGAVLVVENGQALIEFETFEIMGVIGHSDLLFHWGCYNKDSEGCVLLGKMKIDSMITDSRQKFVDFMVSNQGVDEFDLNVSS